VALPETPAPEGGVGGDLNDPRTLDAIAAYEAAKKEADQKERLLLLEEELADAEKERRRVGEKGQRKGETREAFETRLVKEDVSVSDKRVAVMREKERQRADRIEERKDALKLVEDAEKKRDDRAKRRKDIMEGAEDRKREIAGGVRSGRRGIDMPGGLQSIGGYFAGADASRRAQADKAARVQEQIAEVNKQMLVELKRLSEGD